MSMFFGDLRQIGYVVRDIEKAMAHWTRTLGVGPWLYMEDAGVTEFRYQEKTSVPPVISIALANSGGMQVELIQQRDTAPSMYLDSLGPADSCAQHIAYWTVDGYDDYIAQLAANGYIEGHGGSMGNRGRFGYFHHPDLPGSIIEIVEITEGRGLYFERIHESSRIWKGHDPIRRTLKR